MDQADKSVPQNRHQRNLRTKVEDRKKSLDTDAGSTAKQSGQVQQISREQGQRIPADSDPDDPVSS